MVAGKPEVPNSVRTLRRYWKDRSVSLTPALIFDELMGESHRTTVMLASALLDDTLTFRLGRALVIELDGKQLEYIFRFEGPLGTFSSRTEITCLFGIIDGVTRAQLDDIREMRNACAHSTKPLSFASKELTNVAKRIYKVTPERPGIMTPPRWRARFVVEVMYLWQIIEIGREQGIERISQTVEEILASRTASPDK
jgi:hypothetical protein